MTDNTPHGGDFWSPEFDIAQRGDGSILMSQRAPLAAFLPTLADYLDQWADAVPARDWLVRRDACGAWQALSYGDARARACRLGAGLLKLGLGPDRPLLILSGNSLEHALLGAACFYVGIPCAPLSPAWSLVSRDHARLRSMADRLVPGAIFADDGAAFARAFAAIARTDRQIINAFNHVDGAVALEDLAAAEPEAALVARARVSSDTVVKYLMTSGSTGPPGAVINTNKMICAMQAMVRDCYRFLEKTPPVVVDWAPWSHTAAGNKVFYLVMTNGGTLYIDDGRPVRGQFDTTLRNLREIACTWYFNVPIGWDMLADALEHDAGLAKVFFSRLQMMFYAGAGMAQHIWTRLSAAGRKARGQDILLATALGATETAPFALACTQIQEMAGNVGVPARGMVMKLVPTGDQGRLELRLKGPNVTPGYLGDRKATMRAFDDEGFYRMGDSLCPVDAADLSKGFRFAGRIAENFKLATGTWVVVGAVRAALIDAMGGLIADAVIVGENERETGALLLLSRRARAMPDAERDAALLDGLGRASRSATGSASRVVRAVILNRAPDFDAGEITEKGTLNQIAMRAAQADTIAALYRGDVKLLKVPAHAAGPSTR